MSIATITLTALGRPVDLVFLYEINDGDGSRPDLPPGIEVAACCYADEIPRPFHEDAIRAVSCVDKMTEAEMERIESALAEHVQMHRDGAAGDIAADKTAEKLAWVRGEL